MKKYLLPIPLVMLVLLIGCASHPSDREMNSLASALTKVSAAVDASARYKRSTDTLDEKQLLQVSTAHDAGLMKPFEGMTVRVLRVGRDSAVLVCQANNGRALLEDAACTARLDAPRWNTSPNPCEFTLDVKQICAR
ncbi:hypothetical protein [Hydrogenophaga sp. 2FB]|uniref:hypothetical protein n=1 Tax=Hydrogenophaga sp. 2FB TaxID=2502187 RepID=UPI0010F99A80|nr:hypothetical protein [Hydrogenophaga sp. 2FB]